MSRFRIVVAGCGSMADEWVRYALTRDDVEIVALVDIKEENAKTMADKYDLHCGFYKEIEEAIKGTGANLVFDITIPEAHKSITMASLELGCNVFGEKPMASSMEEAREMVAAAEASGKMYAVMQNRRYNKNIRAFRQIITSGAIGQPWMINADFFLGPHFGGFRDLMDSPLILDMAIHTFDQARFIAGGEPISVYCHEFNPESSWYKGNASAVCIFELSNGAVFCYRGSWCSEGYPTSWESSWRVSGKKGTALWDGIDMPSCEVVVPTQENLFINEYEKQEAGFDWSGRDGHLGCLDEMFSALIAGRKAETDCRDNVKSMEMVFGALESAKKGVKIKL